MIKLKNQAISFDNIYKKFGGVYSLNGVSFCVPKNSIIGLIGSNGSGKTTSIKCLLNFYSDYNGDIKINNVNSKEILRTDNIISYIPDSPVLYEELTVIEHFQFISAMYETEDRVKPLVDRFQLKNHINKFPHELSKGTSQKVLIGCALLREFEILIADEPFDGLDPLQIIELRDTFKQLKEDGKTVLVSTHLLSIIEPICDYYVMLDKGNVVGSGNINSILKDMSNCNSLEDLYMYLSKRGEKNER